MENEPKSTDPPDSVYFNQDGLRFEVFNGNNFFRREIRIAKLQPTAPVVLCQTPCETPCAATEPEKRDQ